VHLRFSRSDARMLREFGSDVFFSLEPVQQIVARKAVLFGNEVGFGLHSLVAFLRGQEAGRFGSGFFGGRGLFRSRGFFQGSRCFHGGGSLYRFNFFDNRFFGGGFGDRFDGGRGCFRRSGFFLCGHDAVPLFV